ncbi:unannotated protein [freshwater metagenome]|uniref:Unannotated protein n=1 Tax=freshwater metagenome TaxID=449393 RepID=A0A6J7HBS6_9ZZZZ|nr:DUF4115 domain-containing protein [Actinomycetota bacterium]
MSVGSQLRRAREAAGLSLAELADRTKIRVSVLEAMERDDFSAAGGEIYVRMQLRSVATALGVPADRFNQPADPSTQPIPIVGSGPIRERDDYDGARWSLATLGGIDRLLRRRRGANWTAAMLVALVAAIAVVVAIVLLGKDRGSASAEDFPPTPPNSAAAVTTTPPPTQTAGRTDDTAAVSGGVTVIMEGIGDRSWVSVTAENGDSLFDGLVLLGQKKTFRDPKLVRVAIGDAGAISLNVNGSALGPAGEAGEVRSLEFAPGEPTVTLR